MDAPYEVAKTIEHFPAEVWGPMTSYLPGEQILRFKLTGAKNLWRKLRSLHVVKSVILGFDYVNLKCWPSALNDLPSISELYLDCNKYRDSDWMPKLFMIPTCLRKFGIRMKSFEHFFLKEDGSALSLNEHVPLLEELDLGACPLPEPRLLPPNLTVLMCEKWDTSQALPPSVVHVKADTVIIQRESKLPPNLESISILHYTAFDDITHFFESLPPSFCSFKIVDTLEYSYKSWYYCPPPRLDIAQFPPRLRALTSVALMARDFSVLSRCTTLVELSVASFDAQSWAFLPSSLQRLTLSELTSRSMTVSITSNNPISSEPYTVKTVPIGQLPKSLMHLILSFQPDSELLIDFPSPGDLAFSEDDSFPPSLVSLKLVKAHLSVNAAKHLPPSLRTLDVEQIDATIVECLPRGLTTLIAWKTISNQKLINSLPPSLVSLQLTMAEWSTNWIHPMTGQATTLKEMMGTFKTFSTGLTSSLLWNNTLPLGLKHLRLPGYHNFGDDLNRPISLKLETLEMQDCLKWTDAHIPFLPRTLKHLNLSRATKITGKCFQDLPQGLLTLNLGSNQISDCDIQHLPATLQTLNLDSNTRLTNDCIKFLPRSLENLTLLKNSVITADALIDLPYKLKSLQARANFTTAELELHQGIFYSPTPKE